MKICYFLGGIGEPKLEFKKKILIHNLETIYKSRKQNYDIFINTYNKNFNTNFLNNLEYIDRIFLHKRQNSHLIQLWTTNQYLSNLNNYDYIIFNLDDLKIINIDIDFMINIYEKYELDILSPYISNATHDFMKKYFNKYYLSISNSLEIYNFISKPCGFFKYYQILDKTNTNIWGPDLFFGYYNIKAGIFWYNRSDHLIKGPPKKIYFKEFKKYANERGFF